MYRYYYFTDMVAKILGPKELFVKEGTPVTLVCHVDHAASLPGEKIVMACKTALYAVSSR